MIRMPLEIINKKLSLTQIKQWILILRNECSLTALNKYSGSNTRNYKSFNSNLEKLLPMMEVAVMPYVTLGDKFTNQLLKYKHKHTILMAILIENKLRINHKIRLGIDFFKDYWGIKTVQNLKTILSNIVNEIVGFDVTFRENKKGGVLTSIDVIAHRIISSNPTNRSKQDMDNDISCKADIVEAKEEKKRDTPTKESPKKEDEYTKGILTQLIEYNPQTFSRLLDCVNHIRKRSDVLIEFLIKEHHQLMYLENNNFSVKLSRALGGIGIILKEI